MKENLKKWWKKMEDFRNHLKEIYSDNDVNIISIILKIFLFNNKEKEKV